MLRLSEVFLVMILFFVLLIVQGIHCLKDKASVRTVQSSEEDNMLRNIRSRILPGETLGGLVGCESFEIGNEEKREFYSPNYPNNYSNGTTCVRTIGAESKEYTIKLDFRDQFKLEPSDDCKYDYLEVRDGRFGYSRLIGKYCGDTFPDMILSSGTHLWLRFSSDENIEYTGFRAVYDFIRKPIPPGGNVSDIDDDLCFINITNLETEFISNENISKEVWAKGASYGVDCMFYITVKENKKVSLQWDEFNLKFPNECEMNYIDVFGKDTGGRQKKFCGAAAEAVAIEENVMQVHFVAKSPALNTTFRAHFTAYRSDQNCTDDEFNCQDGMCIDASLHCDAGKMVNCRTGSDEDQEECMPKQTFWEHITQLEIAIILVVFFLIIFGMCFTLIFNIIRKLVHDYNAIKEHVHQSKDSRLDELGRKTPVATILTSMATVVPNMREGTKEMMASSSVETEGYSSIRREEEDNCYVPTEHYFPNIIHRESSYERLNGGSLYHIRRVRNESKKSEEEDGLMIRYESHNMYSPEVKDSCCQTRESLFHNIPSVSSSIGDSSSVIAAINTTGRRKSKSTRPNEPKIGFTTFGYGSSSKEGRYKAEAVIEMQKINKSEERPYSVQSSKSAPDVIVTH